MLPDRGVGDRIKVYRRRRGLSQRRLAELVGRSESWLSQVERGILPVENLGILIRLAEVLKVEVRLLTGVPFYLAPNGGVQLQEVEGIRAALSGYAETEALLRSAPVDTEIPSLTGLRRRVDLAWHLRQSSQYAEVARHLSGSHLRYRGSHAVLRRR
jgi:transcriptional regulator with XRE-family HTH domain